MSWYVLDALDEAFERTRKCLLEPFDFWKWVKLALIIFLIVIGSSFNSGGGNYSFDDSDIEEFGDISAEDLGFIAAMILFIIILLIILAYVASVMEFVLVESVVSNRVRFREYSRRFLGKGFNLLLFRLAVALIVLVISATVAVPLLYLMTGSSSGNMGLLLVPLAFLLVILGLVFWVAGMVINSFVNLSIPISLYTETSIFSAFISVFQKFRQDWQQIIVYWLGRMILAILLSIVSLILTLFVSMIALLLFVVIDSIIYFVLSAIASGWDMLIWIVLVPVILIQLFLLILAVLLIGMPVGIFMKYHMLTFLKMWYPEVEIPMFDTLRGFTAENGITSL